MSFLRSPRLPVVILLLGVASPARTQVDPAANGIGLYFDAAATRVSATATAAYPATTTLSAWLVATRVSTPGFVRRFEGSLEWNHTEAVVMREWCAGFDMCLEMPVSDYDHLCVTPEPGTVPVGDVVVLGRYGITVLDGQPTIEFRIPEFGLWLEPAVAVPLQPSSGDWALPVAVLNGQAPVAAQSLPWGGVKVLFR